jgi:hypothetical protein
MHQDRTTADQSRTTIDQPNDRTDVLIAELQDRVRSLEEANRENRRLLAAALERIPPQLEAPAAPSEPRESPETDAPPRSGTPGPPEAEEPTESRPWWRRMFGG